ncbi:MAG: hypothetical protein V3U75_11695 [Methylococcaceae bacterium]
MTLRDRLETDIKNVFMNNTQFADDFVNARTGLTVSVIFDKEFTVLIDDVEGQSPAITCADSDVPGVLHDDLFTEVSTATVYKVTGKQPDGTGLTLLLLALN